MSQRSVGTARAIKDRDSQEKGRKQLSEVDVQLVMCVCGGCGTRASPAVCP